MELKVMASQSWGVYQLKANTLHPCLQAFWTIPSVRIKFIQLLDKQKIQILFFVILISQYVNS
jgi:hypothetical protein